MSGSRSATTKVQVCVYLMIGGALIAARYLCYIYRFYYFFVLFAATITVRGPDSLTGFPVVCVRALLSSMLCVVKLLEDVLCSW